MIDGVELENANGELCGGTFVESFAHSCNSVFGPLGVKVGSKRLVEMAERYGWNEPATLPGAKSSTLPESERIVSPLEMGSTAIGQFKVLATPLQLASVAQTVANDGVRVLPTAVPGPRAEGAGDLARGRGDARAADARRGRSTARAPPRPSRASRWPERPAPQSSRTPAGPTARRAASDPIEHGRLVHGIRPRRAADGSR